MVSIFVVHFLWYRCIGWRLRSSRTPCTWHRCCCSWVSCQKKIIAFSASGDGSSSIVAMRESASPTAIWHSGEQLSVWISTNYFEVRVEEVDVSLHRNREHIQQRHRPSRSPRTLACSVVDFRVLQEDVENLVTLFRSRNNRRTRCSAYAHIISSIAAMHDAESSPSSRLSKKIVRKPSLNSIAVR